MKKIILTLTMAVSGLMIAQSGNVFQDSENSNYNYDADLYQTDATEPGTPGDPVPVDDYLPFLAVAGAALAVYALRRKQVAA